jgi:CHAD domain-containing protein
VTPEPVQLLLQPELGPTAAVTLLGQRLDLEPERPRTDDRIVLDTFDGRLRAAGLRAERPARRAASAITITEAGCPVRQMPAPAADRYLLADLGAGPGADRLAPVIGLRALLPVTRLRSRLQPLRVRNADCKTVVRLIVEHADVVVRSRPATALAPRVHVHPVLGYDKAFERTVRVLTDELGLARAAATLVDEALHVAGGNREATKAGPVFARGARADAAAGVTLARLADVVAENMPGALDDLDTEFLHDLRVAVRRARALLAELRGVLPVDARDEVRDELRWMQMITGPVRDLDVQLLEWPDLEAVLPPGRVADVALVPELLRERRAQARRRLRRDLRSCRFDEALAGWRGLATAPAAAPGDSDRPRAALPIEVVAADRIARVHRRMLREGRRIGDDTPAEALHDLRKRGKELRYLLEMFGGLFAGEVVKPSVSALKALQDVLGRFQDREVQASRLQGVGAELAPVDGGPAALMALGVAVESLLTDQRAARAEFAQRFAAFAAATSGTLIRTTFPLLRREAL